MVGRSPSMNGGPSSRLLTMARLPSMRPLRNASTAGSPAGLAKFFRKRYGPRKPLTFWLSKMIQRSASSRSSSPCGLELAGALGEIGQDHAGLGELLAAVHQHRHFAHLVDLGAVLRRARLAALEEIDVDRLPVGADQIEHQRGAIGVAGLGEAIELVFGHGRSLEIAPAIAQRVSVTGSPLVALPSKRAARGRELRQRLRRCGRGSTRPVWIVGPFAAGEEIARAAALRRDRAFGRAGRGRAERHVALAAAGRAQQPAAGHVDRRRAGARRLPARRRADPGDSQAGRRRSPRAPSSGSDQTRTRGCGADVMHRVALTSSSE